MFDKLRRSIEELMNGAMPPEERRAAAYEMKATLVQARMGLEDLRGGIEITRTRLTAERRELETVQRRKGLAAGINDMETVAIAERYELQFAERVEVLTRKLDAQERELAIAERDVDEMTAELQTALRGGATGTVGGGVKSPSDPGVSSADDDGSLHAELDSLARSRRRDARERTAEEKLAELKRRMGKA